MEFEQYLEKDILTFLDSKISKKENISIDREEEYGLYLTKDYLKELNYALDNDELTRAKKLFDELKLNYARLPKSSIERKKIYSLLERMYDKIQNYVRIKEGRIEIIKQGNSEIYKDRTDKFADINERLEKVKTVDATPEFDFSRKTALPFKISVESKEASKDESQDINIKKKEESNNKKKEEDNKTNRKYYEDESLKEENTDNTIESQNSFVKNKHESAKAKEQIRKEQEHNNTNNNDLEKDKETLKKQENKHHIHTAEHEHIHKRTEHEKNQDMPSKVIIRYNAEEHVNNKKEIKLEELKDEIIDKTSIQLEKLKTQVTEILLNELSKKIEEKRSEEDQKIETIRKEITKRMIDELNTKLREERGNVSNDMSNQAQKLREEILSQIYHKAQHLVASKDYPSIKSHHKKEYNENIDVEKLNNNTINIENDNNENNTNNISNDSEYTNYIDDNHIKTSENKKARFSGEELRVVYEQAIYYMFDDKYEDAAKLFQRIIDAHPTNKAARIRLQECIEKHPELTDTLESISENVKEESISNISDIKIDNGNSFQNGNELTNEESLNNSFDEFKNNMNDNVKELTKDIESLKESEHTESNILKHKYTDEELRKMYEEAIYTMFQNNYDEAAKLFEQILKIRPENKAARIRLHECLEAKSNA